MYMCVYYILIYYCVCLPTFAVSSLFSLLTLVPGNKFWSPGLSNKHSPLLIPDRSHLAGLHTFFFSSKEAIDCSFLIFESVLQPRIATRKSFQHGFPRSSPQQ